MTMKHIETITLPTAGFIVFTGIPQDGTDLMLLMSLRTTASPDTNIQFNGATSGLYFTRRHRGDGSSVGAASTNNADQFALAASQMPNSFTANTFSNVKLYIPNYSGNSAKSANVEAIIENNATQAFITVTTGHFNNTAPITSIEFVFDNAVAGSTASLYTITKA